MVNDLEEMLNQLEQQQKEPMLEYESDFNCALEYQESNQQTPRDVTERTNDHLRQDEAQSDKLRRLEKWNMDLDNNQEMNNYQQVIPFHGENRLFDG